MHHDVTSSSTSLHIRPQRSCASHWSFIQWRGLESHGEGVILYDMMMLICPSLSLCPTPVCSHLSMLHVNRRRLAASKYAPERRPPWQQAIIATSLRKMIIHLGTGDRT